MVSMVLKGWDNALREWDDLLAGISDEQLAKEIVLGRNRGVYLLGHLIAVHDEMLKILGLADLQYPEWQTLFIQLPDRSAPLPPAALLRTTWKQQCDLIRNKFRQLTVGQWFDRHRLISAENFVNEPHRNRLNVVLTRIAHVHHHTGQLALLQQATA